MSEFSETYNLLADSRQDAIELLQRARIEGFVFPPANGWITLLPRSEFGQPVVPLIEANTGTLLNYLYDDDGGWRFVLLEGPNVTSSYSCIWLDWTNWNDDSIRIDDSGLDLDRVLELAARVNPVSSEELERILHPRIEQRTTTKGATYETFADWREIDESPAFAFAEMMGLEHYRWTRWRDDTSRFVGTDAVHVRPDG
jgi:hypothetical protein